MHPLLLWFALVEDSSAECLQKLMQRWVSPCGWPKVVSHDRELHNRGAFAHGLSSPGVQIQKARLQSPEHIGKCERHGGIMKRACKRLVKIDHSVVGKDDVKKAMLEAQVAKNEFIRVGGFRFQPHTVGAWTTSSWSRTRVGRGRAGSAACRQAGLGIQPSFVHEDCSRSRLLFQKGTRQETWYVTGSQGMNTQVSPLEVP